LAFCSLFLKWIINKESYQLIVWVLYNWLGFTVFLLFYEILQRMVLLYFEG